MPRVSQRQEVRDWFSNHDESNMVSRKSTIKPLLDRKVVYERRRYIARCDSSFLRRLWNIEQNFISGAYNDFAAGPLSATNDIVMIALLPLHILYSTQ